MSKSNTKSTVLFSKPTVLVSATILLLILSAFGNLPSVHGFTPNDPEGDPWHLDAIQIHSVWDYGHSFHGPEAVGLCVIGEAIIDDQNGDLNVTEKTSFAWNSDFSDYLPYPSSSASSHEGAVASVAASTINNSIGVAGIVNAPLYSAWLWGNYPVDEVANYRTYVQQMIDIFEWGTSFGRMVFTMSFLNTVYDLELDDPVLVELRNLVTELHENGSALFFVGVDNTLYPLHPKDVPQSLPYVRAIGRVDGSGSYVNGGYGQQLFLVAPAGGVPAYMQTSGSYGTFGGSSCSTPIAASSAVLLWNQFPWASNGQIEDALVWGATDLLDSGWDEKSGYGTLNVEKARAYLAEFVPSANSYRLNWSAIDDPTTSVTSSNTTTSILTSLPIFIGISIPVIASLIVLTVSIKRRRTQIITSSSFHRANN
ncbi:MAG: S8 family serine peptidase [Candidatus Thorarchaeota archaeon]